ncbi:three-helix bundle dimerization domain-containing protein [Pseudarthrobacter oxydans]|uniref:three-helix bundle dimerization domain-containing protein n=1 Tax=Pseudarthrobacter oxydans TaxID=1671 RepID=UPI003D2CF03E
MLTHAALIEFKHAPGLRPLKCEPAGQYSPDVHRSYPETPRAYIQGIVAAKYDTLGHARIRSYIPILVERSAWNRLHRETFHPATKLMIGTRAFSGRK